ncbi:MAG: hypothetical protein HY275_19380, partial [Gemmatimonadetes bacterium]|nr:hypothetical protein [Gemmatimonadota bacterium]
MLRTLLETRRVAQRLRGGATLSVVMHAGVIAAVAAATATAGPHVERPHPQPSVVFTAPPPHPMPPEHGGASAPAPVIGVLPRAPVFTISVDVPDHLPDPGPIAADPSPWPTPATTPRDPGGFPFGYNWRATGTGLVLLVGFNFLATQYIAAQFRYQPALGTPLLRL